GLAARTQRGLRRLLRRRLDWGAIPDLVRGAPDDFIAGLQIPHHFDEVPVDRSLLDVNPFRLTALISDHERALSSGDHARLGHKQRWPRAAHWPLHCRI